MGFPVVYTPEPSRPSGKARQGVRLLLEFIIGTFDVAVHGDDLKNLGIYNPRDVCGNQWPGWKCKGSKHADGAAGDAGVAVVRPAGHPEGHRAAAWLCLWARDLGVQEIIWAGRRWHNGLAPGLAHAHWPRYTGRSDHFDHVHFALNAPAADGLTMAMILAVWEQSDAPPDIVPQEDDMPIIVFRRENGKKYLWTNGNIGEIDDTLVTALRDGVQAKTLNIDEDDWRDLTRVVKLVSEGA